MVLEAGGNDGEEEEEEEDEEDKEDEGQFQRRSGQGQCAHVEVQPFQTLPPALGAYPAAFCSFASSTQIPVRFRLSARIRYPYNVSQDSREPGV